LDVDSSFGILFGDGWGWGCGGWVDVVIGLSTIDGSSDLGLLGLIIVAGEFVGDGDCNTPGVIVTKNLPCHHLHCKSSMIRLTILCIN
jgi:hypothetical protein